MKKSTFNFVPLNADGKITTNRRQLAQNNRAALMERERQSDFCKKTEHLEALIKAFGSQGIGCGHTHHTSPSTAHSQESDDAENQPLPIYPELDVEEAEDYAIQIGKIGEIITSIGGALAIGPVLDAILMMINDDISKSSWFKPNADIQTSPAMLLIAFVLVTPAIYGAPHCHAQLEVASRTRNNFLILAKYAQKLLKWGLKNNLSIENEQLKMPTLHIGDQQIAIDAFTLISPEAAVPLNVKQQWQIMGDVEQHFNEYIGLTIIAIVSNIKNPIAQWVLIATCLLIAAKACYPEVKTCANTLIFMNTLKNGQIIHNPTAINKANNETTFSALAKTPAIFYANFLSFQQICFGNFVGGLSLSILATKGNIITQYFINTHTQVLGEAPSKPLIQNIANIAEVTPVDEIKPWEKLSFLGKELVISRAFGTGNERSEPITITIIALIKFCGSSISQKGQSILALMLCLAGTVTAYSEARNSADHTARVRFFNKFLPTQKTLYNRSCQNDNAITQKLLSNGINSHGL